MKKVISRFETVSSSTLFQNLDLRNKEFIELKAEQLRLSHQDLNNIIAVVADLEMWESGFLEDYWDEDDLDSLPSKKKKQEVLARFYGKWEALKLQSPDYENCSTSAPQEKISFKTQSNEDEILGVCPVFSEKTRCCNLMTLDAVINCGFGCSYCSIQSFYHANEIVIHKNLSEKLSKIKLDPDKLYHIGTGQSSDSLLWGNKENVLQDLLDFAAQNKNLILELKSKSDNIAYLLENPVPRNVILTWSLNAESIIKHEEHKTASLDRRISVARQMADKGNLVGFHLHPIVMFKGWEAEYESLLDKLLEQFHPEEIAMLSLGTLTFIKPVIKQLRERKAKSKILQMPLEDAAGKFSYPMDLKIDFFKHVYNKLKPWHNKVFFYFCMEDHSLWKKVFGFEYVSNAEFEEDMKQSYMKKINTLNVLK